MTKPKVSIIIPAFNESDNYKRGTLNEVSDFLQKQNYSWEVILVDDGSTDNTPELLKFFANKRKGFKYEHIAHGGKQAAVSYGVSVAKGSIVFFSDFDQSTPINEVNAFLKEFRNGADIVIARRIRDKATDTLMSYLRSKVFNILTQIIVLPGIPDTQCGFKAFRSDLAKSLFLKLKVTKGKHKGAFMGAFDVELLFLARKAGKKIVSVPVKWRRFDSNRLKAPEPFLMLYEVVKIRLYDLLGKY